MARILVVDDDPDICRTLLRLLERDGHEVSVADNGKNGLLVLHENEFDLIITDIIMPDQDGLAMIIETKKARPGLRVIALSGGGFSGPEDYLKLASALGADEVFLKPFQPVELLQSVNQLLTAV